MAVSGLTIHTRPALRDARLVLGFSGWMDGGDVSTGTIEYLIDRLDAQLLADIESEDFYIASFPGSMEFAALFRPHTRIKDGLIKSLQGPTNRFFHSQPHRLILFSGKEPHLRWAEYADCLLALADEFNVTSIYFIGSVAGLVPHTREPRMTASVSDEALKPALARLGVRFSNYEGPASFCTYLTRRCARQGVRMANLVAEIPAYIQGKNVRCIRAVAQRLAALLDIPINLDDLRVLADQMEEQLNKAVAEQAELSERIGKLEEDYDNDVFDTQMGDLKAWLQQQGIRLD